FLSGGQDSFYQRIALPVDDAFSNLIITNMAALKGELFFAGVDAADQYAFKAVRFRDGAFEWMEGDYPKADADVNVCAYDGKLWYFSQGLLCAYDPAKESVEEFPIAAYSDLTPGKYTDLFYTGRELLCFNTFEDQPTEVWKLDPYALNAEKLLNLKASYGIRNLYGLKETEAGQEIYVGLGSLGAGGKKTVMEKLIINKETGEAKRAYVSKDMLPEGIQRQVGSTDDFTFTGFGTKKGIYLTGGYKPSEAGDGIETDNWYFDFDAQALGFQPGKKRLSSVTLFDALACGDEGKVYFYGDAVDAEGGCLLAFSEEETWDFGDKPAFPEAAPETEITSLEILGETTLSLNRGERQLLSCEAVYPEGMKEEERPPLLFTSANEGVASVHPLSGELLAKNPGTTKITASCGDKNVSYKVSVSAAMEPSMLQETLEMQVGEVQRLAFSPGYATGNEKVIWTSLDKKVAAVKDGIVTAKKAGKTLIRVTVKDKKTEFSSECYLTVNDISVPKAATGDKKVKLSLSKSSLKAQVGDDLSLNGILSGSGLQDASVLFSVSNPNLIEEDAANGEAEGKAQGKKVVFSSTFRAIAPGTAYIIVQSSRPDVFDASNFKLCKVTITAPAKELNVFAEGAGHFSGKEEERVYVLKKDSYAFMTAQVNPELSTDAKLAWQAKGGAVSVKNGVVFAKKVSKKDKKTGEYVPDVITVKCGKAAATMRVVVEE
ncbi:MAG: Ig-like domain-containing protein, partial [Lachnospiraceae bacterium]|nr:Ig-like domain-containing protein [Lachnospiraceae bacterium]